MKKILGLVASLALSGSVPALAGPAKVDCTVRKLDPVGANFFSMLGRGPKVGDTIEIDLSDNEITDLTFASGAALPIKQAKAKLVKKVTPDVDYLTYFEGTHKSWTSDYIGVLWAEHGANESVVNFELLRKEFFQGMRIHKLEMNCVHLP